MKDRCFSIIIIPHPRGRQRTISVSKRAHKFLAITLPLLTLVLIGILVDYTLMHGTRQKYRALLTKNQEQGEILAQYKMSIETLEARLSSFEHLRRKLNVMAGLKADEPMVGEPGVGGPGGDQIPAPAGPGQDFGRLEEMHEQAESLAFNFSTLDTYFENQLTELAQTPSILPAQGYWSSPYGYRDDPFTGKRAFHPGVDIATQQGNPVVATADGIVLSTTTDKIGGRTIKISHPKTGYITVYCHLSKFEVRPGQKVKRGEVIGLIGRTGRARGPHVHYEVRLKGKRLNPWNFILDL